MTRLIAVVFALVVATSAQAMSPAPLYQPDGMIEQVRQARQAPKHATTPMRYELMVSASFGPVMSPEPSRPVWRRMKAFALSTMGRLRLAALKFGVREGDEASVKRTEFETLFGRPSPRSFKPELLFVPFFRCFVVYDAIGAGCRPNGDRTQKHERRINQRLRRYHSLLQRKKWLPGVRCRNQSYSKNAFDDCLHMWEQLLGSKTIEQAIQVQSQYAKEPMRTT